MASELLKNKTLIQRLKEDKVPVFNFDLAGSALDYNIESIEEELLPKEKPQELFDERDRLQIESLEQSLQDNKPFLMDESVDFIERQNFAVKGFVTPPDPSVPKDFLEEFIAQQGVDSWEEINRAQRSRFNNQVVEKIKQFKKDTKGLISRQELADLIGVDNDYLRGISKSQAYKGGRNPKYDLIVEVLEDPKKIYRPVTGKNLGYYKKPSAADIKKVKSILDADILTGKVINRVNTLSDNKKFMNMLKNKKLTDKEFLPKTKAMFPNLDLTDKKLADAVLLIARGSEGANLTGVNLKSDKGLSKKLLKQFETAKWGNPFHEAAYKYASTKIDEQLGSKVGTFKSYQGAINKKLNDLGIDAKNYNVDEFVGVSIGGKQKAGPYSTFTQVTDAKYNQGPAAAYQGKLSQASTELSNIINEYGSDSKQAKNFVKKFNETTALNHENKYNTKVAKLDLKSPEKSFGKKRFTELGSLGEQLTSSFEEKGFGYKIPKGAKTQKELLKETGQKKLTALQELASGKNVGFDPILASKAGFEEFVKPAAKIGARGAATVADLALSAGAGPIGLGVGALIETGQAMPELTRGNIKEAGRRTIIGSLLPESLVGSMQTDLLKLAETPEEKIAMQNFIDFKKDETKYDTSVKNLRYLENNPFEAEGIDLDILRNKVLEQRADLEDRVPKVFFPEFAKEIYPTLVRRLDAQNVENLEGFLGSVVGRGGIDRRGKIIQEIGEQGISGQEPFYGQAPVQMSPEELDEIYESGIMAMANGGRIGFADGPNDPSRRTFLKFMAGIASLPIVGKFFKSANVAKKVVPLTNTTTTMPEWFPQFVEKALAKGVSKKIDADLTEIEIPELPSVKVQAHDDGRILVEGKNAYNEPYEINYTPPGYEVIDETTGKVVKTKGEFQASDTRFRQTGPELDDVDVDYDAVPDIEDIVGGDSTQLEGFAKGTGETKYTKGQKAVDDADARSQYSLVEERADFDQGPDIDLSDYED